MISKNKEFPFPHSYKIYNKKSNKASKPVSNWPNN